MKKVAGAGIEVCSGRKWKARVTSGRRATLWKSEIRNGWKKAHGSKGFFFFFFFFFFSNSEDKSLYKTKQWLIQDEVHKG